jgi:hypothetical protein
MNSDRDRGLLAYHCGVYFPPHLNPPPQRGEEEEFLLPYGEKVRMRGEFF